MTDDDSSAPDDRASTEPLPAVGARPDRSADDFATVPLERVDSRDDIEVIETQPNEAVDADAHDYTEMLRGDVAMPGDETGSLSAPDLDDPPTAEIPNDQTLIPDLPTAEEISETDTTQVGAVSDDAIVRRVVLPDVGTPKVERDEDATHYAPIPNKPRVPLPDEQRPPARGPVPLEQFRKPAPSAAQRTDDRQRGGETQESALPADSNPRSKVVPFTSAIGLATVWALIANAAAVATWLDPSRLFVLTVGAFLPIAIATAIAARPRDRKFQFGDLRALGAPVGIALVILFVAALPWQLGPIRNALRGFADASPETIASVLADRSDAVVLAECKRVAPDFARPRVAAVLTRHLADRPEVVARCLADQQKVGQLLSGALIGAWYTELLAEATPPARACSIASSIETLDRPSGEVETRLLGCIMHAPPDVQRCCAAALASTPGDALDWVARVQNQPDYVPDGRTAASLLELTFGTGNITEQQATFVRDADFQSDAAQRMAVVLGCAALRKGTPIGEHFLASVPETCPLDRGSFPTEADVWVAVCDQSRDRLIRRRRDPSETLCLGARAIGIERAIPPASNAIGKSQQRARRKTN